MFAWGDTGRLSGPHRERGVPATNARSDPRDHAASPIPARYGILLLLVFLLLLAFAIRTVGSPDVGFHLRAGEEILDGSGWPRSVSFTYTVNDHEYIDTSWGYQAGIALV